VCFEPRDHGDKFPLVSLDSLDLYLGCGLSLRIAGLGQGRFSLFLSRVFSCPFPSRDGETGEVGVECFYGRTSSIESFHILSPLGAR
jgi:hypothetical protein